MIGFTEEEIQQINAEIEELNTTLKSDLFSDEDIKEIEDTITELANLWAYAMNSG